MIKEGWRNGKIMENNLAYVKFSNSPDGEGRIDIMVKKKRKSLTDMTEEERESLFKLVDECKELLNKRFDSEGYEININFEKHTEGRPENLCVSLIPRFE